MPPSRVLIVDDEQQIRAVLRDFLESQGYEIAEAETAVGGLAAVRARRPDVVLLDLNMPGTLHGTSVVAAIAAETAVIVITAVNDVELARRTLRDGAFDFVLKPFELGRVAELVEAAVAFGRGGPDQPSR